MSANRQASKIKRALLSVSDKTGIVELAQTLASLGVEIFSTSGTARLLRDAGIQLIEISDYTGFPEIMDGRVKTLHPKVHAALLGRPQDAALMEEHDIISMDLAVINLYPFVEVIQTPNCTLMDAIENIDIGGPAMIRASAKNYQNVAVVVDPSDYGELQTLLKQDDGSLSESLRFRLAGKAFEHTARYDSAISRYLAEQRDEFSGSWAGFPKIADLRYGENPHQKAALYGSGGIATAEQLQGKALSFNNYLDLDAAVSVVQDFTDCACVIIKHTNPCGVACATTPSAAYQLAYQTDALSAFGGIIAFNRELDGDTAKQIISQQFVEVIAAPEVSDAAQTVLSAKSQVRLMRYQPVAMGSEYHYRSIAGGLLLQELDNALSDSSAIKIVTKCQPSDTEMRSLLFAERVAKHVKSNAIVYAKDHRTIGIGAGQMSRIDSLKIAATKAQQAGLEVAGAVLASDAFFPFTDGIEYAAQLGIRAVIQPGGSVKDKEIIAAADANDIAMVFTGIRHFKH